MVLRGLPAKLILQNMCHPSPLIEEALTRCKTIAWGKLVTRLVLMNSFGFFLSRHRLSFINDSLWLSFIVVAVEFFLDIDHFCSLSTPVFG